MSGRVRVLVVDDERTARRRLLRLLGALPAVEVVGECESGDEVVAWLVDADAPPVDVLLMDVRMPGLSGLEARALLDEASAPYTIFVTAHEEHAVEAFEVGAVDYVVKPVEASRLAKAVRRAMARLGREGEGRPASRLALETRSGVVLLDVATVSAATFDGELVTVRAGEAEVLTDLSLQDLEQRLPPERFVRVHRRGNRNCTP